MKVAALAAIEKSQDSFRAIHDGTRGVRVNPRTKARGKLRSPSAAEKARVPEL